MKVKRQAKLRPLKLKVNGRLAGTSKGVLTYRVWNVYAKSYSFINAPEAYEGISYLLMAGRLKQFVNKFRD
jgi:hypothetical protein